MKHAKQIFAVLSSYIYKFNQWPNVLNILPTELTYHILRVVFNNVIEGKVKK